MVAWRSSLAFSQCDTFLVEYRLSCKHGQTWQQRTAAAKYPFSFFKHILFSSPLHPLILFAHHDTLPCSILLPHLISSHPATIPVSLSLTHHLSRRCGVDSLLQPRPCIPLCFHTSTCSVTLQCLESTQRTHPSSGPLVDLRPSRPAFQQKHYVYCTRRSTFWDKVLAHNDSLNHATLDDDHAFPHLIPGAFRPPCLRARRRSGRRYSCRS